MRKIAVALALALVPTVLCADVSRVERHQLSKLAKGETSHAKSGKGGPVRATGSQALIDNSGVKYFINTDITFSTSSSASGAMSEASYTHAVAATTLNGGTTSSTLNDAYDGYNTLCLSLNNTVATCETDNANFVIYNQNGPATTTCPGTTSGVNRKVVLPVQHVQSPTVDMHREVYVPDDDSYARWENYFTNTGASPVTLTMVVANNLGSDSNTLIVNSSSGDAAAQTTDTWVTTFQNYSGTTSSDPRLGHVFQGAGASIQLAGISFANGNDNPFWGYTFTLQPGETKSIINFAVVQPSKAAAAAKAAELVANDETYLNNVCLTSTQYAEIGNFATAIAPTISKSFTPATVSLGSVSTMTFTISNPNAIPLTGLSFSDTFPAGLVVANPPAVSDTCSFASGVPAAGATSFTVGGGTVGASTSCTFAVNVATSSVGSLQNSSSGVSSTEASTGTGSNTATLVTTPAPVPALDPRGIAVLVLALAGLASAFLRRG